MHMEIALHQQSPHLGPHLSSLSLREDLLEDLLCGRAKLSRLANHERFHTQTNRLVLGALLLLHSRDGPAATRHRSDEGDRHVHEHGVGDPVRVDLEIWAVAGVADRMLLLHDEADLRGSAEAPDNVVVAGFYRLRLRRRMPKSSRSK